MSTRLLSRLPSLTSLRTPTATRLFSSSPPPSVSPQPPVRVQVVNEPLESFRHHDDAVVVPGGWLLKDAKKLKNKVVLITGSGDLDGFGGKLALEAAHYGAKVVVSDSNEEGVDAVVEEIQKRGGTATGISCDFSNYFEQLRLFNYASRYFGQIDVVVSGARVGKNTLSAFDENLAPVLLEERFTPSQGQLERPRIGGVNGDLAGLAYTARLAFYYLKQSPQTDVKAFVSVGSLDSVAASPCIDWDSATNHGVLGLIHALQPYSSQAGINVSAIAPWFAGNATDPVASSSPAPNKLSSVVSALISASTTTESGKTFIVDESGVFTLPPRSNVALE